MVVEKKSSLCGQGAGSLTGGLGNLGYSGVEPASEPVIGQDRLVRLKEILELIPVGKSTWWAGVKSGRYPAPVRHLGPKITAWRLSDILNLVKGEVAGHE